MRYTYVAIVKDFFGKEKKKTDTFPADNAEKARGLVTGALKKAIRITLYQLLSPGEKPWTRGLEYNRSWLWDKTGGWRRPNPGKLLSLSETSDEDTDEEVSEKYLKSLPG
jgi:hypothetical protein